MANGHVPYPQLPSAGGKRKTPNSPPESSKPLVATKAEGASKQATVESDTENGNAKGKATTKEVHEAEKTVGEEGNSDGEDNATLEAYTKDDKKKEVLRILRWPEWAYYEILEVDEDATDAVLRKAFLKKTMLTHTDRNKDVDARGVFQSK
jgi:hypothetical protein